jgi:16S rRNA (adenine1518-N6/adenine1519-N6)-dimethyltransferase
MRARKRFGQHFLHDRAIIRRIIEAIAPSRGEHLVEIGPGRGALTGALLEAAGRLDAVEIDRDLAALLRSAFGVESGFTLHEVDALEFDWTALAAQRGGALRLVGNLPYNISTPLLFRLLAAGDAVLDMHFMLQKEVVDRILAPPGSEHYGRLTVMLAPFVAATRVLSVGPGAFQPPPKVQSAVVRLVRRAQPAPWAQGVHYGQVVAAAFGQRRKTLRNALAPLLSAAQITALGIDPGARAETLEPVQFGALAQAAGSVIH